MAEAPAEIYVYRALENEIVPDNVTRVRVDSSVTEIPEDAFADRFRLTDVELSAGLEIIGHAAFSRCILLKNVTIPFTVTHIAGFAFGGCVALLDIELKEGLRYIGDGAFYFCRSLRSNMKIPSTVERIGENAFAWCSKLHGIEFPDKDVHIEKAAFSYCYLSVVNMRVPPSATFVSAGCFERCFMFSVEIPVGVKRIESNAFSACKELRNLALASDAVIPPNVFKKCKQLLKVRTHHDELVTALKTRFDGLPIHRVCYYHSYTPLKTTIQNIRNALISSDVTKRQDCFGMTPLHILALSTQQDIRIYEILLEMTPADLVVEDAWGDLPINHACAIGAPLEILQLLLETYKIKFPDFNNLDWNEFIGNLCQVTNGDSLPKLQYVVEFQRSNFPNAKLDWRNMFFKPLLESPNDFRANIIRYMIRWNISKRLEYFDRVELKQVAEAVLSAVKLISDDIKAPSPEEIERHIDLQEGEPGPLFALVRLKGDARRNEITAIYKKLSMHELKEDTSILELVAWRFKIEESTRREEDGDEQSRRRKIPKFDDASYRQNCRLHCGADIIISNVLPFLLDESLDSLLDHGEPEEEQKDDDESESSSDDSSSDESVE